MIDAALFRAAQHLLQPMNEKNVFAAVKLKFKCDATAVPWKQEAEVCEPRLAQPYKTYHYRPKWIPMLLLDNAGMCISR